MHTVNTNVLVWPISDLDKACGIWTDFHNNTRYSIVALLWSASRRRGSTDKTNWANSQTVVIEGPCDWYQCIGLRLALYEYDRSIIMHRLAKPSKIRHRLQIVTDAPRINILWTVLPSNQSFESASYSSAVQRTRCTILQTWSARGSYDLTEPGVLRA